MSIFDIGTDLDMDGAGFCVSSVLVSTFCEVENFCGEETGGCGSITGCAIKKV